MATYPQEWGALKAVLSHDWLTGMRGGERVLEILCDAFPEAPLYSLIHQPRAISAGINRHSIYTSWLQRLPGIAGYYRHLLPLFPLAIRGFAPPPADLLISTHHCVAKAIRPPPGCRHLCYCFTPMRYAWLFRAEYLGRNPLKRILAAPLLAWLRRWDRATAARVDRFVAISRHVQARIRAFYGREADVVYPPVELARWTPGPPAPGGFDLVVSALVPYKRLDLAVRAYAQLGFPLKIVGVGGEFKRLRAMAPANVEFLGWQSDAAILALYRGCRALVFPGEEDFGLVPLEAQACGRPVIAYARGGALETVVPDQTGVFFAEQTAESLAAAVARGAGMRWDPAAIRANAERFGVESFIAGLATSVARCLREPAGGHAPAGTETV
jgi:glycosyltransferase involved in cell wall biosynthesis